MYNHQLDAFIMTADLGSFAKAAETLFISSPAVIQQVNLLEGRCGFQLFERTNHGVTLTPAGRSLYEDAKTIIKLSGDALEKARRIADGPAAAVRVGTSLLFKCRLLPDILTSIGGLCPDIKIEILPMPERRSREDFFSELGMKFDVFEGVYGTAGYRKMCGFVELMRTPLCCAVAKGHRFARAKKLTLQDLNGEYLVMPVEGVSLELDAFRNERKQRHPTVQIIDSSYYGVDTFTLCEVNPYILITQAVYADIHPNLVTLPLETDYALPYGLMYANDPTPAAQKFIAAVKALQSS